MSRLGNMAVLGGLFLAAGSSAVRAQVVSPRPSTPQEESRRKLLEKVGLHKKQSPVEDAARQGHTPEVAPAAEGGAVKNSPPAADTARPRAVPPSPSTTPATSSTHSPSVSSQSSPPSPSPSFRRTVHPLLTQSCKACHATGGSAGATRLLLSDDHATDHRAVARFVDTVSPASSPLLVKAAGQAHGGGKIWAADGDAAVRVRAWIQAGARLDGGASARDAPAAASVSADTAPPRPRASVTGVPSERVKVPRPADNVSSPAPGSDRAAPTDEVAVTGADVPAAAPVATGVPIPEAPAKSSHDEIHRLLVGACATCHGPRGTASSTRLVLTGMAETDLRVARGLVDPANPETSVLLTKAAGDMHGGGAPLSRGSPAYLRLLGWARGPDRGPAVGSVAGAGAEAAPGIPTAHPEHLSPAGASATLGEPGRLSGRLSGPGSHGYPHGLALPLGFALNGRFDLVHERRQFSGNPFEAGSAQALRSHHRFLFLSRQSSDGRVGLSVELLSLTFWEVHLRLVPDGARGPWQLTMSAGKILVPFGAEPRFHQSYGGLAGFDQRILPIVWAQEGLAAHFVAHRRELTITDDLYVVRGYNLRRGDAVLNLQSDFSPADDAKLGWGNRLGVAWGPLSAWYSTYYNQLGFGRRLFMQGGDVMLWRLRGVPVLAHLSFAAGLMRADVSGGVDQGWGGPGNDYYHFGSYFHVRYHPTDWFFLQYRQGLRTFDNRRGIIVDDTRLTAADGSTHHLGAVARRGGLSAGVFYLVNLDKVAEIPDDVFRTSLTYEF